MIMRVILISILCWLSCVQDVVTKINLVIPQYQSKLSEAMAHITNATFAQVSSPVFILSLCTDERQDLEQNQLLNDFLKRTDAKIMYQLDDIDNLVTFYPRTNNLFVIDGFSAFLKIIRTMNDTTYNYNGLYLIALAKNGPDTLEILLNIFNECWRNYITNINVLVESFDGTSVNIYTYFPFLPGKCYVLSPFLYNTYLNHSLKFDTKIFPEKTKNFNKCQVIIAAYEFPPFLFVTNSTNGTVSIDGIDARLISTLSERLNFTPVFLLPTPEAGRGGVFDNGTVTGVYKMLMEGLVNFTIGGHGFNLKRAALMLPSYNYFNTKMVFAIPRGLPYSSFEKLFFPFDYEVWLTIACAFLTAIPLVSFLRLIDIKIKYFLVGVGNDASIFTMFALLLGQSGLYQPKRNFARTVWAIWALSAFILTSSYQGSLFGFMQRTETKSLPKTFMKLFSMGYVLYAKPTNPGLEIIPPQLVKIEHIDGETDEFFEKLRLPGFKGLILDTEIQIDYYNNRFIRKRRIAIHPQNFYDYPICIYFRKNSYMAPAFNVELEKYVVNGFITAWTKAFVPVRTVDMKIPQKPAQALSNDHLAGSYEFGMLVMVFSMFVFLLEILTTRIKFLRKLFDFLTH